MMRFKRILTVFLLLGAAAYIEAADEKAPVFAPGWGKLGYELPQPGTYDLPVIRNAVGGKVLKTDGAAADLSDFLGGKITVLSFIYTSCNDVNGCPLSIFVLHALQDRLGKESGVADHLRLVSFSFDIENDTPEVLRGFQQEHGGTHGGGHSQHGKAGKSESAEWTFLVAESPEALDPVLKAYSQFVIPELSENGEDTGKLSHLLRVFLIDKRGRVRNIYSPDFLHADLLLADVKSLLLMDGQS